LLFINPPNHFNALLPDTKIRTMKGNKNIQDIKKHDFVLTHKSRYRSVYDTMLEYRDEDIYEIELDSGKKLMATGDHPIFANGDWKDAKDLKVGDELKQRGTKRISFCKTCNKEIQLKGKKKNGCYCSQKCMAEGYRKHRNKCLQCGKELIGRWKDSATVTGNTRFCSRVCYMGYKGRTKIEEVLAKTLSE